jgi:hypothetical protein
MKLTLAIAFLGASAVWAADPVPMDVKPGQWESTVTMQMAGMPAVPQIPEEQLAKLPPEQRAKVEAALKQASGGPRSTTNKNCVKKEDLAKLPLNNDQTCRTTLVSSSRSKQEIHLDCDRNGNKQTGTMIIEALNPETIKFSIQAAANDNGKNMSMNVAGTSKWLGAACTDAK